MGIPFQAERRIAGSFAVGLVLLGAVGVVSLHSTAQLIEEAAQAQRTQEVLTHLAALRSSTFDAGFGMRGYVVTGDEAFLEPLSHAELSVEVEFQQLTALTADNPAQQRRLEELRPWIDTRMAHAKATAALRRSAGFESARQSIAGGRGKHAQDQIGAIVATMEAEERDLLSRRRVSAAAAARRTLITLAFGGTTAVAICGIAFLLMRRETAARRRAEDALRGKIEELAVATERAQVADRLKSAFLATMSHELRTPLNSIIGFAGILLQGLAGPLTEEQAQQLEMVRHSARHLLALINDVLDVSKIEAGRLEVAAESFDLRASLEKVAGMVRPLADKKGIALRVEIGPEVGAWVSDPRRVEQVVINLLNNAVKFTHWGEVTLCAEVSGEEAHIRVVDTGIGILPNDMATLFEPFRQVDGGLARPRDGTGLGLAICRRLAGLLGGEVSAQSTEGKGSTFTLTLPENPSPRIHSRPASEHSSVCRQKGAPHDASVDR